MGVGVFPQKKQKTFLTICTLFPFAGVTEDRVPGSNVQPTQYAKSVVLRTTCTLLMWAFWAKPGFELVLGIASMFQFYEILMFVYNITILNKR